MRTTAFGEGKFEREEENIAHEAAKALWDKRAASLLAEPRDYENRKGLAVRANQQWTIKYEVDTESVCSCN